MYKKDRRQQMFSLVEAYRASNQSRKEYCLAHKVPLSTFGWWQHQYRIAKHKAKAESSNNTPGFLRLVTSHVTGSFELCYPDGTTVRFPPGIENERFVSMVRQLRDGQRCSV